MQLPRWLTDLFPSQQLPTKWVAFPPMKNNYRLVTGELVKSDLEPILMRRRNIDGETEFRRPAPDEIEEYNSSVAW